MGFESARQRYIASQKPNTIPTELSGRSLISKKNLNTHMYIHTHIKKLLSLNTVHVPVFLHTLTQQLRVAPDEKV